MTKKDLKRLVEQRVNEAWYNNLDDFYRGVGKCAVGAAAAAGGAYCLDKGLENEYQYNQEMNRQGREMNGNVVDYKTWCKERKMDPNQDKTMAIYDDWVDKELQESKTIYMRRRAIVESMVRKELAEQLDTYSDNDEGSEYDPFMNGDASYLDGEYDIPYGYHVTIDTGLGTVAIDDPEEGEETSYYLQGDEADDLIVEICKYWKTHPNLNGEQVVNAVIQGLF